MQQALTGPINPMNETQPHAKAICGAKTRSGAPCQQRPIAGRKRCRMHGGTTPAGMASPQWKTGARSRYMPDRMALLYEQFVADPHLLDLKPDVALLEARLADLLGRTGDAGQASARWEAVIDTWKDYLAAKTEGDIAAMSKALIAHGQALLEGNPTDSAIWADIQDVLLQRGKTIDRYNRSVIQNQKAISVAQMQVVVGMVIGSLRTAVSKHVSDAKIARQIFGDVGRDLDGILSNQ